MTPENLLETLLIKRGLVDAALREKFLHPKYADLYDPYLMNNMEQAVTRIANAIAADEMICIYSDYDADGIPGGVILHDFFIKIGYEKFWNYIPHRHTEGYGLHKDALVKIKERGTTLVITVDLGITAVSEVAFATELGLEVIVTDHHEPLEVIPSAVAIVNPKLGTYPDRMLCGAGVAFKLVQALIAPRSPLMQGGGDSDRYASRLTPVGWEKWLLDMAGIATLSDMVPLVNENRILAYYGMKVLEKAQRPGLKSLFQKSGMSFSRAGTLSHLTEDDIVFSITPRLNAASRMAHPDDAFKLLATRNVRTGAVAAEHLSALNDTRKKTVAQIMKEVHARVTKRQVSGILPKVLVIGDATWPAGILGLIASKVLETYQVTTFVWGSEELKERGEGVEGEAGTESEVGEGVGTVKGSCRGMGDVAVVELMQKTSEILLHFGGHEDAGGFSARKDQVHFLEETWNLHYQEIKKELAPKDASTEYDIELGLECVTMHHYRALRQLAPFGMGNRKPVFAFKDVVVESVKQFGKTKEHLEIVVNGRRAISWYATPTTFSRELIVGETITLLGEFDHSVFRGKEELRLKIKDVL